jgi:outer membrane protein TolC
MRNRRFLRYLALFPIAAMGCFAQAPGGAPPPSASQLAPAPAMSPASASGTVNGSVPTGQATPGVVNLTLEDALNRALRYNLAIVEGGQDTHLTRAQRLLALSQLMPTLNIRPSVTEEQVNLAALGFTGFPGIPAVVGPFTVYDLRGYGAEQFGFAQLRNWRASRALEKASQLSLQDARDEVVQVVVTLYLQAISGAARIDAVQAQVNTADTLYHQALDQKNAGTVPAIDVLRAQVEYQSQQQRLILYQGDFDKQKLELSRAVGLPLGQQFHLADTIPYVPLASVGLDQSLADAYRMRSDLKAAEAAVQAAELAKSAAAGERLPSVGLNADYGANGNQPDAMHGSFTVAAAVNIPIFEGGRIRANVAEADARLKQRQAELADLRGRIDEQVRTAYIDLHTASRQVDVAVSNLDLAKQELQQARDRFAAGVTNNLEVVQAQEALASANDNYISALYAFNAAKAELARARGESEPAIMRYLRGK